MEEPIVPTTAWNDLYKWPMGQAAFHYYSRIVAEYVFINRGGTQFPEGFGDKLREQIALMADLRLDPHELSYIKRTCYFLSPAYLEWFANYSFNPDEVSVAQNGGELQVVIQGPWYRTIFWEIPLLATISALYYLETGKKPQGDWQARAADKGLRLKADNIRFADFGTRRAYSPEVHDAVVNIMRRTAESSFVGTSNVALAARYLLTPIGTYAHEWVMGNAGVYGVRMANEKAMEIWAREFGANLGTALSDTFTTESFLQSFNAFYAKLFDSVRQDSGDPFTFVDQMVGHYRKLRIDPRHKTIIFSDGLDVPQVVRLADYCRGKINCSFGIGTNLTNDVGVVPLNMVIKLSAIFLPDGRRIPVVKLSDEPGKITGDPRAVASARSELGLN